MAEPPMRIMNFVSEQQLEEVQEKRGGRVEDGSIQSDKTLYEILKENKDKQQAEFNERFKHRPPKALDEDETEFLEKVEMTKKVLERQVADEEAEELRNFKAAVASHTINTIVFVEPSEQKPEDPVIKQAAKVPHARQPLSNLIKIKPQAKRLKTGSEDAAPQAKPVVTIDASKKEERNYAEIQKHVGLVSYSDESEDDEN